MIGEGKRKKGERNQGGRKRGIGMRATYKKMGERIVCVRKKGESKKGERNEGGINGGEE